MISNMGRTPSDEVGSTETGDPSNASAPPGPLEDERGGRLRSRVRDARSTVDERKRSLRERAERERDRHESVRALFRLVDEDRGRGGGLLAGGLAYKMFLWMLPSSLVATSLLNLFAEADDNPPSETAKGLGMGAALAATVGRAATQAGRATPVLLVMGLVLMLWASRGVLKALRLVSSLAWSMRALPLGSATRPTLAMVGVLTVFCVYGFVVAPLYRGPFPSDLAATMLAMAGMVAITAWATRALPHPEGIRWLAFVPGAILFALGIEVLRLATTFYFAPRLERVDDLYGAVGFAAVFMAYLYLVARLAVLALMVNAAVHHVGHPRSNTRAT
jgi:membrane protein